ncbi:MAG: hypothetical protein WC223_12560 [Bacteroidales bacterium]|jgi:hypothetical protein
MKLLETIYQSLQPKTSVSNMRLNSTLIIVTGCLSIIVTTILFAVAVYKGKAGVSEIIAYGTVITSFTGIGIWGKAAQKKTEIQQLNSQTNG